MKSVGIGTMSILCGGAATMWWEGRLSTDNASADVEGSPEIN